MDFIGNDDMQDESHFTPSKDMELVREMIKEGIMSEHHRSRKKKLFILFSTAVVFFTVCIILGEILIAIVSPQETEFPRAEYSAEYGFMNYKNTKIVNEKRRKWRFVYTTNQFRNRGKPVLISNEYDIPNIIILGDSYSFGIGVNDGEEYASIMTNNLKGKYNVVNTAVGGWGLTQQIRRYYEFGQLYSPKIVLLQFCLNDLNDNYNNQVTIIENGKFKFIDSKSDINWIKKYLSASFIQKSQIYSLVRNSIYIYFAQRHMQSAVKKMAQEVKTNNIPVREQFYNDLLEMFANDLKRRGIRLIMISVNDQLRKAPHVKAKVLDLDARGLLDYIEVADFFVGVTDYSSLQGHIWGKKAHHILGEKLSEIILSSSINNSM